MFNIIEQLGSSITDLSEERINIRQFCQLWRTQTDLLAALPPQFAEVMENLLGRMEASSLFTEESCSFSQADLTAQLRIWLKKATARLNASA
ncbi:hypothetical protein H8L32_18080 [Undibacterium sp. CY18W]|uniref:Uncharacterized protein n=1 Tax=Undibacterium hunanense TaxID=2762292 RepID=A0ABR6ZU90_9BURK|nr:hypothetical protein [Undibacterium hunanense]MBC3919405.1 hypothetical protein [Undibacterium hunanense]